MLRETVLRAACLLLFIGLAAGFILQIELLKPGVSFLNDSVWPKLLTLHIWATPLSLLAICLSTMSFVRHKETWGLWGIWLGFCLVPIAFGVLLQFILSNSPNESYYLSVSLFVTAYRHAFGIAILMAAFGGLSAVNKMKSKRVSRKISFGFALSITATGIALTTIQAGIGINGLPKGYIDYPYAFAPAQFLTGIAAMTCMGLSAAYLVYLWRCPSEVKKMEEVF